jgi:hypothetical protein
MLRALKHLPRFGGSVDRSSCHSYSFKRLEDVFRELRLDVLGSSRVTKKHDASAFVKVLLGLGVRA